MPAHTSAYSSGDLLSSLNVTSALGTHSHVSKPGVLPNPSLRDTGSPWLYRTGMAQDPSNDCPARGSPPYPPPTSPQQKRQVPPSPPDTHSVPLFPTQDQPTAKYRQPRFMVDPEGQRFSSGRGLLPQVGHHSPHLLSPL